MTSSRTATVTLPSDTQILISREFDASKHLVYRAYTEPDLVKRWWAGDRGEVVSIDLDLRVGGKWRYVMTANGGFEVAFNGEFTEVETDNRLGRTEIFEGMPDAVAQSTLTLTETDGRTLVEILVTHTSTANRDAHLNSGMELGLQEALDHLEKVAVELGG